MDQRLLRTVPLVAVLVIFLVWPVAAQNLVTNPGFEHAMDGWGIAFGGAGTANAIDTDTVRSGEHAFYAKSEGFPLRVGAVQNVIVPGPGRYRIGAHFLARDVQVQQSGHGVIIRVQFQNEQNGLVQGNVHIVGDIANQGEWTAIGQEVVVPAGTHHLRVEYFLWYAIGEVWWDDMSVEWLDQPRADGADGPSLTLNSSFDDGLDGWETWTPAGSPEIAIDTEVYQSAPHSARVTGFAPTDRAALVQRPQVEGGQFYTLSAWIKTEDVSGNMAYLRVQFNDADNAALKTRPHLLIGRLQGTHDWTLLQETFLIPPGTGSLIVEPFLDAAQGTVWWDDIKLVAAEGLTLSIQDAAAETLASGTVRLRWSVPEHYADSTYRIYRAVTPEFNVTAHAPIGTADRPQFIDRNTAANRTYYYKIVPIDPNGQQGEESDVLEATVGDVSGPRSVAQLFAEGSTDGIRLTWQLDDDTRARQVRLERGIVDDEGAVQWRLVGLSPGWMTEYVDRTLPAGTPTDRVRYRAAVISPEGSVSSTVEAQVTGVIALRERAVPVGEHPSLFITSQEISDIKAVAEANPGLNALLQSDIIRPGRSVALAYLTREVTLPPKGNNSAHSNLAAEARRAALGYAFTGEEMMAQAAKKILLTYAQQYKTYPLNIAYDGRVTTQTLNESPWLINLVWAYDLILSSGLLTDEERTLIEEDLLWNAVHVIERYRRGRSNWQAWHNAAIGAVAFVLNDTEWINTVIDGPQGFTFHIREGLMNDGLWWEQAIGYHTYTVQALAYLAEAAWRNGYDLYSYTSQGKSLKQAFDAPLYHAFTDGLHPVVGNTSPGSALGFDWTYGLATLRYEDPRYVWLWRQGNSSGGGAIPSILYMHALQSIEAPDALTLGLGNFAPAGVNVAGSTHFADSGMTLLRAGGPEVVMLYKPHGTNIGHQAPDNLTILLEGPGGRWLSGPGSYNYDRPEQGSWYKQTVARNGVVIDETSQHPQSASEAIFASDGASSSAGELLHFVALPSLALSTAATDRVYNDVSLERTVLATGTYVIDRYVVSSPRTRQIDWVVNVSASEGATTLDLEPKDGPLGSRAGYQHITDVRSASTDATWQASWTKPDGTSLHLTMLGGEATEVIRGTGFGPSLSAQPILLARRHDGETEFVAVMEVRVGGDGVGEVDVAATATTDAGDAVTSRPFTSGKLKGVEVERALDGSTVTDRMVWHDEADADAVHTLESGERFSGRMAYFGGSDADSNGAMVVLQGALVASQGLHVEAEAPTDIAVQWTDTSATVGVFGDAAVQITVEGHPATGGHVYRLVVDGAMLDGVQAEAVDDVSATAAGLSWTAEPSVLYVVADAEPEREALRQFVVEVR